MSSPVSGHFASGIQQEDGGNSLFLLAGEEVSDAHGAHIWAGVSVTLLPPVMLEGNGLHAKNNTSRLSSERRVP